MTQVTTTLKDIAALVADDHAMTKKDAEAVLSSFLSEVGKELRKGNKLRIVGLGILEVRKRASRIGRNPATGEAITIPASKKIAFRPSKELKESI